MIETKNNRTPSKSEEAWKGIDVLLIIAGIILFFLISTIIIMIWLNIFGINTSFSAIAEQTIYISVGAAFLESIALIGSVYLFGLKRRHFSWAAVGVKQTSQKWLTRSLIIGLLAIPLSSLVAIVAQYLLDLPLENPQLPFLIPTDLSPFGMLAMVVLVGIVIPFAEELFFRGVLYKWLRDRLGVIAGTVISSIIFGAIHGEVSIAIAAFVLGIILALVYEYSKSLWPCVLIHAINNAFKVIALYILFFAGFDVINF